MKIIGIKWEWFLRAVVDSTWPLLTACSLLMAIPPAKELLGTCLVLAATGIAYKTIGLWQAVLVYLALSWLVASLIRRRLRY